jgi:hypothetical protein
MGYVLFITVYLRLILEYSFGTTTESSERINVIVTYSVLNEECHAV